MNLTLCWSGLQQSHWEWSLFSPTRKTKINDEQCLQSTNNVICKSQQLALRTVTHSKKKSTSERLFWCFRLSQIEHFIQYLEGPNSTWKDYDRNLEVQVDPKIPIMILPGTIWSFQVLNRVQYLRQPKAPKKKRCSEVLFFVEFNMLGYNNLVLDSDSASCCMVHWGFLWTVVSNIIPLMVVLVSCPLGTYLHKSDVKLTHLSDRCWSLRTYV